MSDVEGIYLIQLAGVLDRPRPSVPRPLAASYGATSTRRRSLLASRLAATGARDITDLYRRMDPVVRV